MYVTIVHVRVKPENIVDFTEATRVNHEASILEAGNCRFDILQSGADDGYFILYEAYATAADAAAHKDTPHYLTWRDTVADWMAEARQGVKFNGLFPVD